MKIWENAEIETLEMDQTQYGGEPSMKFDQQWFDDKGSLVVNFES